MVMASTPQSPSITIRLAVPWQGCLRTLPLLSGRQHSSHSRSRLPYVTKEKSKAGLAFRWELQPCCPRLHAYNNNNSGSNSASDTGDEDDELDRLLGIGRYRDDNTGFFSTRNQSESGSRSVGSSSGDIGPGNNNAGDTLADIMQMEVRRVRAKEELMSDLEDRKAQMRAIGEEMKAALAREYELDRLRTEIGANYAMSEALHALDDVEADVQRIKQQLQADKAELAAWEAQSAEERSRGLFFKSLYAVEKEPRQPVGKSIPGYWRKQRAAAAAAAAAAESTTTTSTSITSVTAGGDDSSWMDPEAVAAAAQRPLSAASRQVRSPLRLYLFSYLSAFLALLVINDLVVSYPGVEAAADAAAATTEAVTVAAAPHVAQDALYGMLSAGLGFVAVQERQALGEAQEAMLEGIRRTTAGSRMKPSPPTSPQQQQQKGLCEDEH